MTYFRHRHCPMIRNITTWYTIAWYRETIISGYVDLTKKISVVAICCIATVSSLPLTNPRQVTQCAVSCFNVCLPQKRSTKWVATSRQHIVDNTTHWKYVHSTSLQMEKYKTPCKIHNIFYVLTTVNLYLSPNGRMHEICFRNLLYLE